MRWEPMVGAEFTPKNFTSVSASSQVTGGRGVGRKKISRVSCAEASYRFSVTEVSVPSCSDGEGVVATFFLMRYQRVVARRREINFARQFRWALRIRFFIGAVQQ